ncbi:MAG: carbohydrate binding domain-containing protein, partial [Verrucomicrobiota bacterium]
GHLFAGKKRIRFFGVNLAFGGNFPAHADAEKIAARMAKFGINCVRFHHMDNEVPPNGLLQKDRITPDPEMLDRLDYFIAQLKKNGIYSDLNLHVSREYPGFAKWNGSPGYFKGVDNFYPPMIALQHDYARALLGHVNPYTGLAYANEPAVAFVEINNENGLISEWGNGGFDEMPDPYAADLRRQWNAWLANRYGGNAKHAKAWNQGAEPLGGEMIKGDFAGQNSRWLLEQHEGAVAGWEVVNAPTAGQAADFAKAHLKQESVPVAKLTVTRPGAENWHVQASYPDLKTVAGKSYTLDFFAKSSRPRKISVAVGQAHAPWQLFWSSPVTLAGEWKKYHFVFTASETDDHMRIVFSNFGTAGADAYFSDVSLRPGGVAGFKEGEAPGDVAVFQTTTSGSRTPAAQRDWHQFLYDAETRYWTGMRQFIRDELHSQSLIVGSAAGFSPWSIQAKLDVVDAHEYWQHPQFPHKPWDLDDWTVRNIPMAGEPGGGGVGHLAMMRVADKPFIVTEYNHAAPNTYSSEAFLEVCAVAALQDWDGVFAFAYSHRTDEWDARHIPNFFDIDQHPLKMATLPAAVALFLRGDIQPPKQKNIIETTPEAAMKSVEKGGSWSDARAYGIQLEEAFQHPVAMRIGTSEKASSHSKSNSAVITSDNGELTWDTTSRRMLINTPRSAGLVGAVRAGEIINLGGISITPGITVQNWATITVTVLEGADLKTGKRLLITATGYVENSGMHWKDAAKSSVGRDFGKAPSMVEGIPSTITLPLTGNYKAWSLDERGRRKNEVLLKRENQSLVIELSPEEKTLWWEIAL